MGSKITGSVLVSGKSLDGTTCPYLIRVIIVYVTRSLYFNIVLRQYCTINSVSKTVPNNKDHPHKPKHCELPLQ